MFKELFINSFNIRPNSKVAVISGHRFNPELFGYNSHVPYIKDYNFLYVVPEQFKANQIKRILVCKYKDSGKESECGHIRTDFGKFFDHLRSHSGERPFTCHYENCNHAFSFKENLKRHLHSHMGIKRFECEFCSQKFSNNQNLRRHMVRHR